MRRLTVFLASSLGDDPLFAQVAAETGRELAARGIGLVYGGGRSGLMGVLADACLAAGGEVDGVIPRSMVEREWAHTGCTRLHVVESMHERKQLMADLGDAFLALPGGLGTLEEIFEAWTWHQLGFVDDPIGFLDVGGFWSPLLTAIDGIRAQGLIRSGDLDVVVEQEIGAAIDALAARVA